MAKKFYIGKISLDGLEEEKWTPFLKEMGFEISSSTNKKISIEYVEKLPNVPINEDEAYAILIDNNKIVIIAVTDVGIFWAMQTLRQLAYNDQNKSYIEGCSIIDFPAFRVRGIMQDVGRTYISIEELKKEIAKLSEYKINTFHWHLTENQGWRLESKLFPMLNDSINYERMPGQYYTLEEAKDLVEFCKNHNILLIPEIDMPGHSKAFENTFRHDMQSKEGMLILKLLMDEVCETFDVPYLEPV